MAEGLPFAATDHGLLAGGARVFGDVVAKFMAVQGTGGSSTVADAYEKMRVAGAWRTDRKASCCRIGALKIANGMRGLKRREDSLGLT